MTVSSLTGLPCSRKSVCSNSDIPRDQATSGLIRKAKSVLLIVARAVRLPLRMAFNCPSSPMS
jgi:hypothetical protein